jgi:hypothetical protein
MQLQRVDFLEVSELWLQVEGTGAGARDAARRSGEGVLTGERLYAESDDAESQLSKSDQAMCSKECRFGALASASGGNIRVSGDAGGPGEIF